MTAFLQIKSWSNSTFHYVVYNKNDWPCETHPPATRAALVARGIKIKSLW